jgi:hypothetical protein
MRGAPQGAPFNYRKPPDTTLSYLRAVPDTAASTNSGDLRTFALSAMPWHIGGMSIPSAIIAGSLIIAAALLFSLSGRYQLVSNGVGIGRLNTWTGEVMCVCLTGKICRVSGDKLQAPQAHQWSHRHSLAQRKYKQPISILRRFLDSLSHVGVFWLGGWLRRAQRES